MTIEFHCTSCNKLLRTGDDKAGKRASCPDCGEAITVPAPDAGDIDFDFSAFDTGDEDDGAGPPPSEAASGYGTPGMKNCPMCGAQIRAAAVKCRHCGETLGTRPTRQGTTYSRRRREELDYAGFWMRFGAHIIDQILLAAVIFPVAFVLGMAAGVQNAPPGRGGAFQLAPGIEGMINVLSVVVQWLYYALFEASEKQGTLGKMALGIKVTDENGDRISFGRATGRHFAKILSGCTCLIGYLMAGWTERKQAMHDMMAGCLVVRK